MYQVQYDSEEMICSRVHDLGLISDISDICRIYGHMP